MRLYVHMNAVKAFGQPLVLPQPAADRQLQVDASDFGSAIHPAMRFDRQIRELRHAKSSIVYAPVPSCRPSHLEDSLTSY
jgi:hypothetical protein